LGQQRSVPHVDAERVRFPRQSLQRSRHASNGFLETM
jgi:hypothetical protein